LAVGRTGVNGVLEVDAFADGVAFDDFVAHFVGCVGRLYRWCGVDI
jgi:hypothetical protein